VVNKVSPGTKQPGNNASKTTGIKSLLVSGAYFPPQVGGISHFMEAISSALGSERVCCLTGVPDDIHNRRSVGNGSQPRVYRRPTAFSNGDYLQALAWSTTLGEIMIRERPRAIQFATASESYLGPLLRRWLNLPFVIYAHGNEILAAMRDDWQKPRLALQQADRIFANSRYTAHLVEQAGAHPKRIEILNPGCDTNHFRPLQPRLDLRKQLLGARERDRVVLSVGGLVARKGQDMVIRALPHVLERIPDTVYLIVGGGPDRERLESLAVATGVRDRVVFAGYAADSDLPHIYALSDVFIMPSRINVEACDVEGFGLVFLEAGSCGKPVIGGRSGGIPDAIVEDKTGFLVNPHDYDDIAQVLVRLLSDKELSSRMGEQGRLRVINDFSWAQVSNQVQDAIDAIVQEQPTRRAKLASP
jgi:phosphatidylinositol alpha-1,6-mannosyltransferase